MIALLDKDETEAFDKGSLSKVNNIRMIDQIKRFIDPASVTFPQARYLPVAPNRTLSASDAQT